jgi:integrase
MGSEYHNSAFGFGILRQVMAYLWRRSKPVLDTKGKPVLDETGKPKVEQVGKWLIIDKLKVNGTWRNRTVSTDTVDQAKAQKALGRYEERLGTHSGGRKDSTVSEFMSQMRQIQSKAVKSYFWKDKYTYDFLEREFGRNIFGELTPRLLTEWQDGLLAKGLSGSTVHKYMGSLRHIINIAIRHEAFTGNNPFLRITLCKPSKPREFMLSVDEQARLLKACLVPNSHNCAMPPQILYDVVFIAMRLGLRRGEIIGVNRKSEQGQEKVGGLRVRDLDPKTKVLKFYRPKTDSMTEVDLSGFPQMVEVLERNAKGKNDPADFLFTFRDKPLFGIDKAFRLAVQRAKFSKHDKRTGKDMACHFHDLRKVATVSMLRAMPLEVVAHVIGDDIRTLHKFYANSLLEGHVKAGMRKFSQSLRNLS